MIERILIRLASNTRHQEESKRAEVILRFLNQIIIRFDALVLKQSKELQVTTLSKLLENSSSDWLAILIKQRKHAVEYQQWKVQLWATVIENCELSVIDQLCAEQEDCLSLQSAFKRAEELYIGWLANAYLGTEAIKGTQYSMLCEQLSALKASILSHYSKSGVNEIASKVNFLHASMEQIIETYTRSWQSSYSFLSLPNRIESIKNELPNLLRGEGDAVKYNMYSP